MPQVAILIEGTVMNIGSETNDISHWGDAEQTNRLPWLERVWTPGGSITFIDQPPASPIA